MSCQPGCARPCLRPANLGEDMRGVWLVLVLAYSQELPRVRVLIPRALDDALVQRRRVHTLATPKRYRRDRVGCRAALFEGAPRHGCV
eukprot:351955-Chlamydomonas_euryale.AAC.28